MFPLEHSTLGLIIIIIRITIIILILIILTLRIYATFFTAINATFLASSAVGVRAATTPVVRGGTPSFNK